MALRLSYRGFSLVEVMIASTIFSIAVVGIYASLASVKQQSMDISDKGLGAALCAQQFLENKRAAVDMRDWNAGGQLAITAAVNGNGGTCDQNGTTYTLTYQVVADGNYARKATVSVSWP